MKIAIRLDDITEDMDWEKFLRFKELLDIYGIKALMGVIPDSRDQKLKAFRRNVPLDYRLISDGRAEDFWEYLKYLESSGHTLALHGCEHLYKTKKGGLLPLNAQSEFAGLPFSEQFELLSKADSILKEHGINTDIFMAPAHSYDNNTLRALIELDYCKITDGFGFMPYRRFDMTFYPISFNRSSVQKSGKKDGCTTFVYHTNTMSDKDFASFENFLEKIAKGCNEGMEIINYSDFVNMKPVDRGFIEDSVYALMALAKRTIVRLRK